MPSDEYECLAVLAGGVPGYVLQACSRWVAQLVQNVMFFLFQRSTTFFLSISEILALLLAAGESAEGVEREHCPTNVKGIYCV